MTHQSPGPDITAWPSIVPEETAANLQKLREGGIGSAIRGLRKARGITQQELAQKSRLNRTTIARIECGIFKSVSLRNLEIIAQSLQSDLQTLLDKAGKYDSIFRGSVNQAQFVLNCPGEGFRIASLMPQQKAFFFGKMEIDPQKTIASSSLPGSAEACIHLIDGRLLLTSGSGESLLRSGDFFACSGAQKYELYNPDQIRPCSAFFITCPSFLSF